MIAKWCNTIIWFSGSISPIRLRGCKNRPAPFPGQISYKATKPGSVCPVSWPRLLLSRCVLLLTGPHFMLCYFVFFCVFCLLVVLVRLSVPVQVIGKTHLRNDLYVLMGTLNSTHSLTHSVA